MEVLLAAGTEVAERAGPVGERGLEAAQRLLGETGVVTACLVVAVAPSAAVTLPNAGVTEGLPELTIEDIDGVGVGRGGLELSISIRVGFEEVEEAEGDEGDEGAAWKSAKSSSGKNIR